MAATDEWAHRACLRMADVTVMHSVTTSATGLTATVMGLGPRLATVSCSVDAALSSLSTLDMAGARQSRASACGRGNGLWCSGRDGWWQQREQQRDYVCEPYETRILSKWLPGVC